MSFPKRGPSGNVRFVEGPVTLPRLTHVYLPELHRQLTERSPVGPVGRALQRFVDLGPGEAEDPLAVATARAQLHDILKKVNLRNFIFHFILFICLPLTSKETEWKPTATRNGKVRNLC